MQTKECKHERFFGWIKEKMTAEDALHIKFGEKGKDFPAEMKKEFIDLFNRKKEFRKKLYDDKKAFMDKWKKYIPEDHDGCSEEGHDCFHGQKGW